MEPIQTQNCLPLDPLKRLYPFTVEKHPRALVAETYNHAVSYHYSVKPLKLDQIRLLAKNAIEKIRL